MINCDVLIVGTGISGLFTALNLNSRLNIVVLSKSTIRECNSYLAQGGISVARNVDDIPSFIEDTLNAGNHKNSVDSVSLLAKQSLDVIDDLISLGVNFDRDKSHYSYTKEGGHKINRILHCKDETGKAVMEVLISQINKRDNITILENTTLVDIYKSSHSLGGIAKQNGQDLFINSKTVVLATGGIGGLFKSSTNFETLTGDGLSICYNNDVELKDMEYLQLHPTVLFENSNKTRRLLLSESLRGEGGILRNLNREIFVDSLLPRDKVSAAILSEIKNHPDNPYVYLDLTHLSKEYLTTRFPFLYSECLKHGFNMEKDLIPVCPGHHYTMGGVKVDEDSRTSLPHLYAVGEVSCTGVHGSNRLASNSLLEGLVFSKNCAIDINKNIENLDNSNVVFNRNNTILENKDFINYIKRKADSRYDRLFNC
ncbi:MAG: L-aspartate oxidase [Clostridium sp.]